jgi:hypothetical protein
MGTYKARRTCYIMGNLSLLVHTELTQTTWQTICDLKYCTMSAKSSYTTCKYPACGWTLAWTAACGPWTTSIQSLSYKRQQLLRVVRLGNPTPMLNSCASFISEPNREPPRCGRLSRKRESQIRWGKGTQAEGEYAEVYDFEECPADLGPLVWTSGSTSIDTSFSSHRYSDAQFMSESTVKVEQLVEDNCPTCPAVPYLRPSFSAIFIFPRIVK